MAKKEETISMVDTFAEFKELKNIDRTTMISVLEESFRNVLAKMFGTDENFDIIVNPDKGDFEIWRNREVVEDDKVEDPNLQISLSEAKKIDADYEVGEEVTDEVFFEKFGRRAILNLRQTLASKILELQKDAIYNQYNFWFVFTAGFTPIPYKLITITAGVFKLNIPMFIIASIVSRGLRIFLFGWLIWKYGAPIKVFIDKYFNWLAIAFTVLLIGSFVAVKYIFQ